MSINTLSDSEYDLVWALIEERITIIEQMLEEEAMSVNDMDNLKEDLHELIALRDKLNCFGLVN